MEIPQLEFDKMTARDVIIKKAMEWPSLRRTLAMSTSIFEELNFSGYVLKNDPHFDVKLQKKGIHRVLRLVFTDGDLTGNAKNDYLLDVIRDSFGYGYLTLTKEFQEKIGFLNIMYGEVYNTEGQIEKIDLTAHLVVSGDDAGTIDSDSDINKITATLLASLNEVLVSLQAKADSQNNEN